jgi:serine/threonine protein kinase/cytochrome c-type biogenesis protein CcmH/NrfG
VNVHCCEEPIVREQPNVRAIFDRALEIESAQERVAYLVEACGADADVRREVETLLSAHSAAGEFLEASPAAGLSSASDLDPPLMFIASGTIIGRYKILEPIGEGGYGTVFMAEQTTPVQRRVALKIIKAGMDTRQVIARFEAERQALALMDHPNIAKVFDAGVTDTGRPYFVMELVKGTPITKYCDEHKLTPKQRLELFIQVCHAVQHAHQKGIIHRDLKPTNVLVAQYDGTPVPKVIDFGVAKAAGQQLTERTMFTGFGDVVGTPQYMSPEQAELNQLDVDTRSDIYSLGVLLYELLTGTTPLEGKRVREAALLEVLRVIREEEPPRPSTRLTTTAELPSIAAQRGLEPKRLSGIVRGELDWIVMKALEKDRTRRYETANGFAMDVQRYLDDEAVHACPPSAGYRFRKFARRNKRVLLAGSTMLAMLLVLVAGLAISNVRVARERNQKSAALSEAKASAERAEHERQRAESNFIKARTAVTRILAKAATGQDQWSKLSPELRKVFSDETAAYYQSLIQEGSADPAVRFETAVGFRSLGYLHGSAKEFDQAEKYYRRSIQTLELLLKDSANDLEYRHQLAYSKTHLGSVLRATTRPAEAQKAYKEAARLYEGLLAQAPTNADYPLELWRCYNALFEMNRTADLERRTLEFLRKVSVESIRDPLIWNQIGQRIRGGNRHLDEAEQAFRNAIRLDGDNADAHHLLAGALYMQGKYDEAEQICREWLARVPNESRMHSLLGLVLLGKGKLDESIAAQRKAIELNPKSDGAYMSLGNALKSQRKPEEAAAAYRKAIELNPNAGTYVNLGNCLREQQKFDEAAAAYRKAIELDPRNGSAYGNVGFAPWISPQVAAYQNLVRLLREQKKLDDAGAVCQELIRLDPKNARPYLFLAMILRAQNKPDEAIAALTEAVALSGKSRAKSSDTTVHDLSLAIASAKKAIELDPSSPDWINTLGMAFYRAGDWNAADAAVEESMQEKKGGDSHDWFFVAMIGWQLGNKDNARVWYQKAVDWMEANAPQNAELIRLRAEAAELLGVNEAK